MGFNSDFKGLMLACSYIFKKYGVFQKSLYCEENCNAAFFKKVNLSYEYF